MRSRGSGVNRGECPIYDFEVRGRADGLTPSGASKNLGGESQVSYLLAGAPERRRERHSSCYETTRGSRGCVSARTP